MRGRGVWLACALVAACTPLPAASPEFRFSESVRQLGLTPVYPPREDFSVGDVYISGRYDDPKLRSPRSYLGSVDKVRLAARRELAGPVAFAETARKDGRAAGAGQTDLLSGGLPRRGELPADRVASLPLVAFPSMTIDAGTAASAGILRPLQGLGLFGSRRTTVTLDFADTRTYGISPVWIRGAILAEVMALLRANGGCDVARTYLTDQAATLNPGVEVEGSITIITRVYLTRSINYTYRDAKILALAERALASGGTAAGPAPAVFNNTTIVGNGTPAAADSGAGASTVSLPATTGDGFQFVGLSGLGLTLNRSFDRPVAVAYEGLEFAPSELGCSGPPKDATVEVSP